MSNCQILCFVLGWQGGTVFQIAEALDIEVEEILTADAVKMENLCRKAQLENVWRRSQMKQE